MLKVTQAGCVCLDFICLLHHTLLLICCLHLGGVCENWFFHRLQFCCLWNVCNSSYIHIYFLNIPLCPLSFILTRPELPWFVRLVMWSLCLSNGYFSCLQTFPDNLHESEPGTKPIQVQFCWATGASPASQRFWSGQRKHKATEEECGLLLGYLFTAVLHKYILLSTESYRLVCFSWNNLLLLGKMLEERWLLVVFRSSLFVVVYWVTRSTRNVSPYCQSNFNYKRTCCEEMSANVWAETAETTN